MWWIRSASTPVLASTSSPAFNGILGTGDARAVLINPVRDTLSTDPMRSGSTKVSRKGGIRSGGGETGLRALTNGLAAAGCGA